MTCVASGANAAVGALPALAVAGVTAKVAVGINVLVVDI
jgi:hypothetical protein